MDLLLDAVVTGVLLGCFYAAVSIGLSVSFGLLDVPHVAHPAFLVLASYAVYFLNDSYDIDPLVAGLLITPLLFVLGLVTYRLYYETFERRGSDAGVRGIAFFFGVAFIIEVLIILHFGVDQRSVTASYIGKSWRFGDMRIPLRLMVAFAVATGLTVLLATYLSRTFMGRAIRAVAQDEEAVRLMGANPVRIKQWAFGIATAVLGIAGALPNSVDGALHLARTLLYSGERVCDRQTEVVMTVRGDRYLIDTWDDLTQRADEISVLLGHAVTDGIGNVNGGCARRDDRFNNSAEKRDIGTGGIFGGKFNVGAK